MDSKIEKNYFRVPTEEGFEVHLEMHRAFVTGGGLQHSTHILVDIDGDEVMKTQDQTSPPVWNERITLYFKSLQPAIPSNITLSVFKKRWTSSGYKLVGTHTIPLNDLMAIVGRGIQKIDRDLVTNKRNLTLQGNIIFAIEVRAISKATQDVLSTPDQAEPQKRTPSKLLLLRQNSLSSVDRSQQQGIAVTDTRPSLSRIIYELIVEDLGDALRDPVSRSRIIQGLTTVFFIVLVYLIRRKRVNFQQDLDSLTSTCHKVYNTLEKLAADSQKL